MTKNTIEEDIAFNLAWEAMIKKDLNKVETYSERIALYVWFSSIPVMSGHSENKSKMTIAMAT